MSKMTIKSVISSEFGSREEINGLAIRNDNKIYFNGNGANYVIEIVDNGLNLIKTDKEKKITLMFQPGKKVKTEYVINNPKMVIELETETNNLKINKDGIEVEYLLKMNGEHSDKFNYKLTWEV